MNEYVLYLEYKKCNKIKQVSNKQTNKNKFVALKTKGHNKFSIQCAYKK